MKYGTLDTQHLYAAIRRVDDDQRIVEGYCFVNEEVGDGYRLTRGAMEAAAADYMRWGAVREMHTRSAVGTAMALDFDDKGVIIRAKIVDDAAWAKVKEGVYKGFSVGVNPRIVRGKDVLAVDWVENSLVDRPKDPDAAISLFRIDSADAQSHTCVTLEGSESLDTVLRRAAEADAAMSRVQTVEADLKKANDRITELERMADPNQQRPHLGGAPVQRTDDADPQKAKRDELQTLQGTDWTTKTTAEKNAAFVRMQELRNDLGV